MISAAIGVVSMAAFWVVLWLIDKMPRGGFTVGDQIRLGEELHRIVAISGTTITIVREATAAFRQAGMAIQEFSASLARLARDDRQRRYTNALLELRRVYYRSNAIEVSQEFPIEWFDDVPIEVGGRLYGCTVVRITGDKVRFRIP